MSFEVAVRRRLGPRTIEARFSAASGLAVLFGPSGSGKTSILNMIAGLLRPDSGHVSVGGTTLFDSDDRIDLAPERRRLGYVFQDGRLFPHRKVRNNLLYGFRLAEPERRWMAFERATAFLGIGHLLDRWPATLSGGEAQRVAIGRALLAGSRALLMDEPLASLDAPRKEEILEVVASVRDTLDIPILYVTHDEKEAERLGAAMIMIGDQWR